jgi:hypothetical protein
MAGKHRSNDKKEGKAKVKRVVTEIAPGIRTLLDAHIQDHNEEPERVSSPLTYTDVVNQALDEFLPARPKPQEDARDAQ